MPVAGVTSNEFGAEAGIKLTRATAVYRKDVTNGGDMASPPHKYLPLGDWVKEIDYQEPVEAVEGALIIGGGGALIWPHHVEKFARYPGMKIVWGIGANTHGATACAWPASLREFDLVGLRDWGSPFEWVPCASCLAPVFDQPEAAETEAVVYEHKDFPLGIEGLPLLKNNVPMEAAVRFLMRGRTIVTNSYHGAYWGTLLGRAVVLMNPFSSKFHYFKHQPPIAAGTWFDAPRVTFPKALAECRAANLAFGSEVAKLLTAVTGR